MIRSMISPSVFAVVTGLFLVTARAASADSERESIADAQKTIAMYKNQDPGLVRFFERAAGYAVFPTVAKGAAVVGGARGKGILFARGVPIGRATLTQVTVGAQMGGQTYSEVIFFETREQLEEFAKGEFAFSGQASAVALKSGASANARFKDGVAVFTATKAGLMFEASLGGQKFSYEPFAVLPPQ